VAQLHDIYDDDDDNDNELKEREREQLPFGAHIPAYLLHGAESFLRN
jgi:hypothetical protein